jgi:predicted 3-demethylubiquinone-9 3-methyltransferase (glyoxalase superfamily)
MPNSLSPFLMFDGNAEAAINFYLSVFPGSQTNEILRYRAGESGPEGTIKKASFTLVGQTILATDSPIKHAFSFTPAVSLFVECESGVRT